MPVRTINTWIGTASEEAQSERMGGQNQVNRFCLVNKSGTDAVVNLSLDNFDNPVLLIPKDLSIPAGGAYEGFGIVVEARDFLVLTTSAEIDFYFGFARSYPSGEGEYQPALGIQQRFIQPSVLL